MVNRSALCELGLLPVIWPQKDVGDIVWLMQGRSLEEMKTNGICKCSRKPRLPGSVVTHKSVQKVNNSSESDEGHLHKDVKCKSNRHNNENKAQSIPHPS